jgi:type IV secretion system protein VirD4
MTKHIKTTALSPILDPLVKAVSAPNLLPIWGVLGLMLILAIFARKPNKYGRLADGRTALDKEIAAGVQTAIEWIEHPSLTRSALYIAEPIGCEIPTPENIRDFKGTLTPVLDPCRGVGVYGNQGAGKSETIINQLIKSAIAQGFGVLMIDKKGGEQAIEIIPYAVWQGYDVSVFAPGFPWSARCNILHSIADENDSTTSDQVIRTIRNNLTTKDEKRDAFFDGGGESMISGFMLLAKWIARLEGNPDIANLMLVDALANADNLTQRLSSQIAVIPYTAYRCFAQLMKAHGSDEINNTEASLQSVASSIMKPLISSKFVDVLTEKSDFPCFDPDRPFWIGEKNLAVMVVSEDLAEVVLPLIVPLLEQLGNYNLNSTRPRNQILLIALDELGEFKLDVVIDNWLPLKRSRGGAVLWGMQFLAQAKKHYGEEGMDIFLGCANSFYGSTGSVKNAEIIAKEFGEREILVANQSRSRNGGTHPSRSESESDQTQKVNVIDPLQLKQFPIGQFVVDGLAVSNGRSGTDERVGIPYIKRFARLNDVRKQQQQTSKQLYEAFIASETAAKAQEPKLDLDAAAAYYRQLVDKYLPATPKQQDPIPESNKPPKKNIQLSQLLEIANTYGYQFEGDLTERAIAIPANYSYPLSIDRLLEVLATAGLQILQPY